MQFQVPQNVTMEDRIIGTLSMLQFIILLIGGFAAFFIFSSETLPGWLAKTGGVFLALITVVLALGKFNDQPMYRFFRYLFAFLFTPKVRVWHKTGQEVQLVKAAPRDPNANSRSATKNISKEDFARLAAVVDSRGQIGSVPQRQAKKP